MEDDGRYRDYVTQLVSKRAELEIQFDAFFQATSSQEPQTRFFRKTE